MPEIPKRDEREKELQHAVQAVFDRWSDELERAGYIRNLEVLPHDRHAIEAPLFAIGIYAAKQTAAETGMSWGWQQEQEVRETITDAVVLPIIRLLEDSTAKQIRDIVEAVGIEVLQQKVFGRFKKVLAKIREKVLSIGRSKSIGATETTRAVSNGRNWSFRYWQRAKNTSEIDFNGKRLPAREVFPVWETEDDDRVCPICGPLDGKPAEQWGIFSEGPPAHPICRCDVGFKVLN